MCLLTQKGDTLLVTLPVEIDHHYARVVAEEIDEALLNGYTVRLVFDFGNTRFMDSSGIGLLVGRYRKVVSIGGRMNVQGVSPQMAKILQLSGIEKMIGKYEGTK